MSGLYAANHGKSRYQLANYLRLISRSWRVTHPTVVFFIDILLPLNSATPVRPLPATGFRIFPGPLPFWVADSPAFGGSGV
jgi:hypothetical protein